MNIANLKLWKRLALGFGVIGVMLLAVQVLSLTMLGRVNEGTDDIVKDKLPKIEVAYELNMQVNDIAIALRNMMLSSSMSDVQKQKEIIANARKVIDKDMATLQRLVVEPKAKAVLAKIMETDAKYLAGQNELIKLTTAGTALLDTGVPEEAKAYLNNEMRPILASYKAALGELIDSQKKLAEETGAQANETYTNTLYLMIGLGVVIFLLAAAVAYWITVSITKPVAKALKIANTVASGDLTSRIEVNTTDEMGQLLQALKAMNDSLVRTVSEVRSGTETIVSASSQIASGNQDLSSRTEQQASSLEETASSMEELTSTVKQNADNARQANTLAEAASNVAVKGGEVIDQVVSTMGEINASANKIVDIIGVIDGIAFQTNILALNAAVEAARAGEQGRGFAVVAGEVRNLAQRSAAAAKEIKALIDTSVEKVENGSKLVNQAGATMEEIVESVKRVTDIMGEITAASQEQTSGIEQINQAISQMDEVTQQNAALVEEAAAAAASMQNQASKLTEVVSVFRLNGSQTSSVAAPKSAAPVRQSAPSITRREPITLPAARSGAASPRSLAAVKQTSNDEWEEF